VPEGLGAVRPPRLEDDGAPWGPDRESDFGPPAFQVTPGLGDNPPMTAAPPPRIPGLFGPWADLLGLAARAWIAAQRPERALALLARVPSGDPRFQELYEWARRESAGRAPAS